MPFVSESQRRFMYARHPEIARRWRKEYGPQHNLPKRKKRKKHSVPKPDKNGYY